MNDMEAVSFSELYKRYARAMLTSTPIHTGEWQAQDTSSSKVHATYEMLDMRFGMQVPRARLELQTVLSPFVNMPWAEKHFLERVGGVPLNPPPSHVEWPWSRHNAKHQTGAGDKFSHTYPERFWPKHAGEVTCHSNYVHDPRGGYEAVDQYGQTDSNRQICDGREGIRSSYGDLDDVIKLLRESPFTRQAYLPIWFPEDTGGSVRLKERVPCTLGYHFMIREHQLHVWYYIRSCDLVRHFVDDIYMACRLVQWVRNRVGREYYMRYSERLQPGRMMMNISSLHAFVGDKFKLEGIADVSRKN